MLSAQLDELEMNLNQKLMHIIPRVFFLAVWYDKVSKIFLFSFYGMIVWYISMYDC